MSEQWDRLRLNRLSLPLHPARRSRQERQPRAKPAAGAPPRSTRALWDAAFCLAALFVALGVWVSWFDPTSRLGSPFVATGIAFEALGVGMRTWWLLQALTVALGKTTEGFQQALRAISGPVLAPESAAERLAAPAGGSGHPRPAERLSEPEEAG